MGFIWLFLLMPWACAERVLLEKIAAQVNNKLIYLSDIHHFRKTIELRGQLDPLFRQSKVGTMTAGALKVPDSVILDALIDDRLVSDQFPVSPVEVDQQIQQIQAMNHTDRAGLERALAEQGHTFNDYRDIWRVSLSKKSLHASELQTRVVITRDDLRQEFYRLESQQGRSLEYRLRWLRVPQANYRTPELARQAAEAALTRIRAGEKFDSVATATSEDASKEQGGDLGFLAASDLTANVRTQVQKLKLGEVSPLFLDSGVWTVLRVDDIRSASEERFKQVEDQLRANLTQRELAHQTELWQARQRGKAMIHRASGL